MKSFNALFLAAAVLITCAQTCVADPVHSFLIKTGGLLGEVSFSPDNRYLALSGWYLPQNSAGTKLFDVPSWREIAIKNYSTALKKCAQAAPIAWSPDAMQLFISTGNNDLAIVDVKSREVRKVWETPTYQITAIVPLSNGVVAVLDGGLDYYDVNSGKKIRESVKANPTDCGLDILTQVDGDLVYGPRDGGIVMRNIKSGKTMDTKNPTLGADNLAVSRNQKELAVTYINQSKSPNGMCARYVQLLNASDLNPIGDEIFVSDTFVIDQILFDHDDQSLILLLDLPYTDPVTKEEKFDTLVQRLDLKSQQFSNLLGPMRAQPKGIAESNDGYYLACSTTDGVYIVGLKSK